jgi:anti-sigma regulatory factor (Ser/Thr protein kinase)
MRPSKTPSPAVDGRDGPALVVEALAVPATAERLDDLHAALERFWRAVDGALASPPDSGWRARFTTAVAEIAANIVRHAHPRGTAPTDMGVQLQAFPAYIEARLTDYGIPYVPKAPVEADISDTADLTGFPAEGGYGLALVRATVDDLDYSRTPQGQNQWRLVKRL